MVLLKVPCLSLASAALWGYVHSSYLSNDLSFGHNGKISPSLRAIPNWHLVGNPNPPEIYSNKIVLTPPVPGNQRGAAWAEKPLENYIWMADIDFRATGPERGGGNLQIWYAAKGKEDIGTASIYTVGKFDGLALVIDQYAGSGGFIRGFLNDGSTEYKSHHSVDALAFGHCEYSYRNLGRPSRIAIRQTNEKFSVEVDGNLCFDSTKIKLPLGYNFGLSAASAENADSFEIFQFVVTTESHTPDVVDPNLQAFKNEYQQAQVETPINPPANLQNQNPADNFNDPPDVIASEIKNSDAQFADLHNRLQAMMKHISALNRDLTQAQSVATSRANSLKADISRLETQLSKLDSLVAMEKKLDAILADVRQTKQDLHNSLDRHVTGLRNEVRDSHGRVLGSITSNAPGIMGFLLVVFGSQGLLILAYVLYKRRKANGPKKYL